MSKENDIIHGFKLQVAGDNGPTIFYWSVVPEDIKEVRSIDSGGAKVTVNLPNGKTISVEVIESKEEIESRIVECRELDEKFLYAHGN